MRVVLDTNVIISALNFSGNERRLLESVLLGRLEFYISAFIMKEVEGVLTRKFGWSDERASQVVRYLEETATVIEPQRLPETIEGDHADNRILECAAAAGADYLVTGDRRHLLPIGEYAGARIVNASQFLSETGQAP